MSWWLLAEEGDRCAWEIDLALLYLVRDTIWLLMPELFWAVVMASSQLLQYSVP